MLIPSHYPPPPRAPFYIFLFIFTMRIVKRYKDLDVVSLSVACCAVSWNVRGKRSGKGSVRWRERKYAMTNPHGIDIT